MIVDEAGAFRLSKSKEHKRLLKNTQETRDVTGLCVRSSLIPRVQQLLDCLPQNTV